MKSNLNKTNHWYPFQFSRATELRFFIRLILLEKFELTNYQNVSLRKCY